MTSSSSTEILIRHASPTDLEAYKELRLEALKNHPNVFGQDYDNAASKPNEYWENTLKINAQEKVLFFATNNSQLIGMTGIYRNMSMKTQHAATIWGVYVKPDQRGKQISEKLINSCLNWGKEQNILIVKLAVVTNNIPAIRCYEKCGFKIYGTEPKAIFHAGNYYDEYLMSTELT